MQRTKARKTFLQTDKEPFIPINTKLARIKEHKNLEIQQNIQEDVSSHDLLLFLRKPVLMN